MNEVHKNLLQENLFSDVYLLSEFIEAVRCFKTMNIKSSSFEILTKKDEEVEIVASKRKIRPNLKIAIFHLILHVALVYAIYLMITRSIPLKTYLWSKISHFRV